jgi:hypothetical protein
MQNFSTTFFVSMLLLIPCIHASDQGQEGEANPQLVASTSSNAQPASRPVPIITTFIDTVGSHNEMYSSTIAVPDAIEFIKSIEEPGAMFGCDTPVAIPFKIIYGSGESHMDISYLFQPLGCKEPCERGFVYRIPNVSFLHSVAASALPFMLAALAGGHFKWSKERILCTTAFLGMCTAAYGLYAKRQPVTVSQKKFFYKKVAVKRELDYMLREATSLDSQHSTLRWDSTSRPADAGTKYPMYQGVQTARGTVIDARESVYKEHERDRLFRMHADTLDLGKLQEAHQYNQHVAKNLDSLIDSITTDRPVLVDDEYRFSRLVMPEIEQHATVRAADDEDAYDRTQLAEFVGVPRYPKTNSMFVHEFYKFWQRWYNYEKHEGEAKRDNAANGLMWGGLSVTFGALTTLLPSITPTP